MLQTRVIPALLLNGSSLVKTKKFRNPIYIGDPINTVRIFNELEVDELIFLDINASISNHSPNFEILKDIAKECFMPLGYGGGITNFEMVQTIFSIGFEKVVLNTVTHDNPNFITQVAEHFGNQAVIASIDVKKNIWGKYEVWSKGGKWNTKKDPVEWALEIENLGAGEILLTSINREGSWSGFDNELIKRVSNKVSIPVIAHGGAGKIQHIVSAVKLSNADAVALGSMVVYQKEGMGVLINFPDQQVLETELRELL
jgi:cyclase